MSIITDDLEDKCRRIVRDMKKHDSEPTPATFVGREMALTLDHIDTAREQQRVLGAQLLERELDIGTQILNTEERRDLVPGKVVRMQLVNALKQTRDKVTSHTQRLAIESESTLQKLQTRLLQLLNMHDQLSFKHGYTKNTV